MANVKSVRRPVEYIYLDRPGIESLYAQIVDNVETSRITTTQKGISAKGSVGIQLKDLLIKLVSGVEGEASAEVTGSRTRTEQSTSVETIEHKLLKILTFMTELGTYFFTDLGEAIRSVQAAGEPVFISVHDRFNAPQFYGSGMGTDVVNAVGYLLLEKGGAMDYDDGDGYFKQPTAPVKLSARIEKMRTAGTLAPCSHEAVFFRGFAGRHVPLYIFGKLDRTPDYLQIKPFAIWR